MNLSATALLLLGVVGVAIAGMYLLRRRAPAGGFYTDVDRAGAVFGVVGTAFAVLLAFVIFVAFESYNTARQHAQQEADAVQQLYATTNFLSPPTRDELQGQLICYSRAVIHDEWPAMRHQRSSPVVDQWVARLEASTFQLEPVEEQDKIALSQWLERDAQRQDTRHGRIAEATPFVPTPLWAILLLGGAVIVVFMLSFADSGERFLVQALMIGAVTTIFLSSILFVNFLDHPYENASGSIKPVDMTRTLEVMNADQKVPGRNAQVPCDPQGREAATRETDDGTEVSSPRS
jgi:hypothetical protein